MPSKGATVIAMFERFVGVETFRKGVQRYLKEHAFGNGTAAEFLKAISTEAGRDVAPAFSTFLDQPGVPIVSFDLQCAKTPHLHLTQQRYLPQGSPGGGENQLWQIPVCVRFPGGSACTLLDKKEGDLELKSCPAWVMPNDGGTGYYRALPSAELLKKLEGEALKELSAPEKLAMLSDLSALVRAGKLEFAALLQLAPKLAGDKNRVVVQNTAGTVGWLRDGELITKKEEPAYAKYIRDLFGTRAHQLGWTPKKADDEDTRILRSRILPLVADVGDDKRLIDEAKKLANAWLADHKSVDPDLVDRVLEIAAQHGDRPLYDKWLAAAKAEKDRAERRRLLGALSSFRDPAVVSDALAVTLTDAFDPREGMTLFWGATREPATRKLAWKFMLDHFDALVQKLPRDYASRFPFAASGICDDAMAPEVKSFFAERSKKFQGGPRNLDQALEQLHLCAVYKQAQSPNVQKFFAGQSGGKSGK
jgi:alanyl aminopeptidase